MKRVSILIKSTILTHIHITRADYVEVVEVSDHVEEEVGGSGEGGGSV